MRHQAHEPPTRRVSQNLYIEDYPRIFVLIAVIVFQHPLALAFSVFALTLQLPSLLTLAFLSRLILTLGRLPPPIIGF